MENAQISENNLYYIYKKKQFDFTSLIPEDYTINKSYLKVV